MKKNQIQLIRPDAPQNSPSLPLKKHTKYFFHTLRWQARQRKFEGTLATITLMAVTFSQNEIREILNAGETHNSKKKNNTRQFVVVFKMTNNFFFKKKDSDTLRIGAVSTPMRSQLNTAHFLTNLTRAKAELETLPKSGTPQLFSALSLCCELWKCVFVFYFSSTLRVKRKKIKFFWT